MIVQNISACYKVPAVTFLSSFEYSATLIDMNMTLGCSVLISGVTAIYLVDNGINGIDRRRERKGWRCQLSDCDPLLQLKDIHRIMNNI